MSYPCLSKKSFTLIELLVVIAIIAILAAIVLVALNQAKQSAWESRGMSFSYNIRTALSADLVGEWTFDSGSGAVTNVVDDSGNGKNGTWNGAGTHWVNGKVRVAGQFNGTNDYVNIPDSSNLDGLSAFTISVWAKGITTMGNTIISKYDGQSGLPLSYFLWYDDVTGNLEFVTRTTSTITFDTNYHPGGDNNWHHYAAIYDGAKMKVYVDSVSVGNPMNQTGIIENNSVALKIGAYTRSSSPVYGAAWRGLIDEVRIYKAALTTQQIQQLYAEGLPRHLVEK